MDDTDRWWVAFAVAVLSGAVILLCYTMRQLEQDVALLRITAAVPEIERHK